jgi:hypothetical protein
MPGRLDRERCPPSGQRAGGRPRPIAPYNSRVPPAGSRTVLGDDLPHALGKLRRHQLAAREDRGRGRRPAPDTRTRRREARAPRPPGRACGRESARRRPRPDSLGRVELAFLERRSGRLPRRPRAETGDLARLAAAQAGRRGGGPVLGGARPRAPDRAFSHSALHRALIYALRARASLSHQGAGSSACRSPSSSPPTTRASSTASS